MRRPHVSMSAIATEIAGAKNHSRKPGCGGRAAASGANVSQGEATRERAKRPRTTALRRAAKPSDTGARFVWVPRIIP